MAKADKICIVCGEGFKGTAKAECCGPKCRKRLERLKEAGKKPEYALVGGKNTKPVVLEKPAIVSTKKVAAKKKDKKSTNNQQEQTEESKSNSSGQPPDPKKDFAAYSKWMREHQQWRR